MRYFLVVLFSLSFSLAIAQEKKFSLGTIGGITWTNPGIRGIAGINSGYQISPRVHIQTALIYEPKSYIRTIFQTNASGYKIFNMDYLVLPLTLRLEHGEGIRIFANAGLYHAWLLGHTTQVEVRKGNYNDDNIFPQLHRTDMGFVLGAGMVTDILSDRFFVTFEMRYNRGLKEVVQTPARTITSMHINSVNLLLGLGYRLF